MTQQVLDFLCAGVDEAGRGPLCAEVVAACVVLDPRRPINGLDDSKKLSARRREVLRLEIEAHALSWAIGIATVEEIDALNILQATLLAMQRAVDGIDPQLDVVKVLVDGNRAPRLRWPAEAVIGGDALWAPISAASILAKQHRDRLMIDHDKAHPGYGFAEHKGYGTAAHREAIARLGPSPIHRRSFEPVKSWLSAQKWS